MTTLAHNPDRTAAAQALLTHQLAGHDVLDAVIAADALQSQAIEDVVAQLRLRLDIDSQVGVQLDHIGRLVGQPREGRTDAAYRPWLKARIRVNRSSGSPPDMYAIAFLLFGGPNPDLFLRQIPVGHVLEYGDTFPAHLDPYALQQIMQEASAIAVPFYQQYALAPYDRFTLAAGATPVAASALGYDTARMVDWAGPGQDGDPYARIAHMFGRSLTDCWDCRRADYDTGGTARRVVGLRSDLRPLATVLGLGTAPVRGSANTKGRVPVELSAQRALATTRYADVFSGSNSWTIGMQIDTSGDFDDRVFEVADNPANEGTTGNNIAVVATPISTFMTRRIGASTVSFTFGTLPASAPATLVIRYDGAGNAAAWINGVKMTASGAHAPVPGLACMTWGEYEGVDDTVPWSGYKFALFDRALSDPEAENLSDLLTLEFTDDAYY